MVCTNYVVKIFMLRLNIPQTVLALRGSHGVDLVPGISHIWSRGGCRRAAGELPASSALSENWPRSEIGQKSQNLESSQNGFAYSGKS